MTTKLKKILHISMTKLKAGLGDHRLLGYKCPEKILYIQYNHVVTLNTFIELFFFLYIKETTFHTFTS